MNPFPKSWAAIILAAGSSTRMGRHKADLAWHGLTFADRLIATFTPHCDPVILVTGPWRGTRYPGITAVQNPNPELGQLSSLQCGMRAVPAGAAGVFFIPVDCPGVSPATVQSLQAAWQSEPIMVPRFEGRRGHPVGVRFDIIAEFLSLDPARSTARDVIHRHRPATRYVDVHDPAILWDIDDPAAYAALTGGGIK